MWYLTGTALSRISPNLISQQPDWKAREMSPVRTGGRFTAIVTHVDSAAKEVWLTTKAGEHTAVLTEPTSYMKDLQKGDELVEVEVIGFRGSYLVCRGPSDMELIEEAPASPVSKKRPNDQGQPSSSSKSTIPSLGVLRDNHWWRTRRKAPCTHYTKGKCNLGYMCHFRHPESNAPEGWRFAELDACGDVRGIPTKGRSVCTYWRDGYCKFEFSCKNAHYKRTWEPEESYDFRSPPSGNVTTSQHVSCSVGTSSAFPPSSSADQSVTRQPTQTGVKEQIPLPPGEWAQVVAKEKYYLISCPMPR